MKGLLSRYIQHANFMQENEARYVCMYPQQMSPYMYNNTCTKGKQTSPIHSSTLRPAANVARFSLKYSPN